MIIRETEDVIVMTTQDDHGRFSGDVARGMTKDWLPEGLHREDCLLAIAEHDRSWLRLDDHPVWNDGSQLPFTFMDYPVLPKLHMYQTGLMEIEQMSKYAALLCSMHFASFFKISPDSLSEAERDFYKGELARQERLLKELGHPDDRLVERHFQLLQLCDDISLYVCLNRDGASKAEEHPWFRDGFNKRVDGQSFYAEWTGPAEISMSPFPLETEWEAVMRSKHVSRRRISEVGLYKAYQETPWTDLRVTFLRG